MNNKLRDKERIQNASLMEVDEILFQNITQLIEYRKMVAIDILKSHDEETNINLRNMYDRAEWHLKQLLGL